MKKNVTNWGRYPSVKAEIEYIRNPGEAENCFKNTAGFIARGLGRCYGDSSLGQNVVSTEFLDNIISFDTEKGVVDCEAGVSLAKLLEVIIPEGWFVPVTPGTKFITVGGALASDVHGKNHHKEGCFADHVLDFEIITSSTGRIKVNRQNYPDLFEATRGGMGLTGLITAVRFQLKKINTSFIKQKTIKVRNLDEAFEKFEQYRHYTYSVSWIDCLQSGKNLGRSVLMLGEHAEEQDLNGKQKADMLKASSHNKFALPVDFPEITLNKFSVSAFNYLYYHKNIKKEKDSVIDYNPFFYPLDSIGHWNRMYGKKGFLQYQFVFPLETSKAGLTEVLTRINKEKKGSFLAVLKLFGKQDNMISFPMEGYTLALDFAVTRDIFPFLEMLDKIVVEYGGRIYMTKDARMAPATLQLGYPRLNEFREVVKKYNPDNHMQSLQSKRLNLI